MTRVKCPCCKFQNILAEFKKHKSHDSFSALNRQVGIVEKALTVADDPFICSTHATRRKEFIDFFVAEITPLKGGVMLPAITEKAWSVKKEKWVVFALFDAKKREFLTYKGEVETYEERSYAEQSAKLLDLVSRNPPGRTIVKEYRGNLGKAPIRAMK